MNLFSHIILICGSVFQISFLFSWL